MCYLIGFSWISHFDPCFQGQFSGILKLCALTSSAYKEVNKAVRDLNNHVMNNTFQQPYAVILILLQ